MEEHKIDQIINEEKQLLPSKNYSASVLMRLESPTQAHKSHTLFQTIGAGIVLMIAGLTGIISTAEMIEKPNDEPLYLYEIGFEPVEKSILLE